LMSTKHKNLLRQIVKQNGLSYPFLICSHGYSRKEFFAKSIN